MADARPRVLVVDDDPVLLAQVASLLEADAWDVTRVTSPDAARDALDERVPNVVLLDVHLGPPDSPGLLVDLRARHPDVPVVMLTADADRNRAIDALVAGAADFLLKPIRPDVLLRVLRAAAALPPRPSAVSERESPEGFDSECLEMRALLAQVRSIAPTSATVLLQGESGTGKERIARAFHALSARASGPFVALNCAAIPENLQESELFGHERGAFTGAAGRHIGHFEKADGGTLFLDEVAELSLGAQAKVLRAIQERTFHRVGGNAEVRSDFRVVAASHRDLVARIEAGLFRLDLYFRLAVFELDVPPLRDRGPDIVRLATRFFRAFAGRDDLSLPRPIVDALYVYPWPGNVRELQNAMQRLAVLSRGATPTLDHLPTRIRTVALHHDDPRTPRHAEPSRGSDEPLRMRAAARPLDAPAILAREPARSDEVTRGDSDGGPSPAHAISPSSRPDDTSEGDAVFALCVSSLRLVDVERAAIEAALARTGGHLGDAARLLGIGRTTLYRRLRVGNPDAPGEPPT